MQKSKRMPRIEVEWFDAATSTGGWTDNEEAKRVVGLSKIHTIGWLFKETKEYLTVVQSYSDTSHNILGDTSIPKPWIVKRRILK